MPRAPWPTDSILIPVWLSGMRRLNPNFMKPIALTGKGADQTAQAAYKSNKFLKGLGLSDKWIERANRTGTASKKIVRFS